MSKRGEDKYRENWTNVQVRIPLHLELKAMAEVSGCSQAEVIEAQVDNFRHMMMTERELVAHLVKYHPEQVHDYEPGSDEDLARMEVEHEAYGEYLRKVEVVLERLQKGYRTHKIIAQRKAIESKMNKGGGG